MEQEKDGILFFPGWPTMFGLLEPFFSILRKDFRLIVFGRKSTFQFRPGEKVVGVSYSAGVENLLCAVREHPEKFSKLFFIAPAGSGFMPKSLLMHYWGFLWEILKLVGNGKLRIAWGAIKETFLNFLWHPFNSFEEVNQIRTFDLWKEIASIDDMPPCFFIFPVNDEFLPPPKDMNCNKLYLDYISSGHLGLMENPWHYNDCIKRIIKLGEQINELRKRKEGEK